MTWRHTNAYPDGMCFATTGPGHPINHCGCTTPDPDPSSPCGYEGCWLSSRDCHCDDPSERCPGDHPINADGGHPHVPTRCRCGHPIEGVK